MSGAPTATAKSPCSQVPTLDDDTSFTSDLEEVFGPPLYYEEEGPGVEDDHHGRRHQITLQQGSDLPSLQTGLTFLRGNGDLPTDLSLDVQEYSLWDFSCGVYHCELIDDSGVLYTFLDHNIGMAAFWTNNDLNADLIFTRNATQVNRITVYYRPRPPTW